ncbi:hypothetical protein ACIHFD_49360 [Nonomuraea sp. NPDC051941]|uniref:hypothetical protein n=1 Tax=Nonomuraea sp. NPDC051941 TaxID=3364373 RepID=UPI0037C746B3
MAVVAADREFGVRRPQVGVDGHGTRVMTGLGPLEGPLPGRIVDEPDADDNPETGPGPWVLGLDPAFWPLSAGVHVVEAGTGRVWTVTEASHRPSQFDASLSYVRVVASLNSG